MIVTLNWSWLFFLVFIGFFLVCGCCHHCFC
jgi:hypothetical protein